MRDDPDLLRLTRQLWVKYDERLQPLRWCPAADVYRHTAGWLIKLEIAGVAADQVEVRVHGRALVIEGRRRDVTRLEHHACQTLEIAYSEFKRVFELPADLERADLETRYQDGMLLVNVRVDGQP